MSSSEPFIAAIASSPGATNVRYGTTCPPTSGRRRACRRRCRSTAGRAAARRTRSGRCTRCAGTRGRCARRAATAGRRQRRQADRIARASARHDAQPPRERAHAPAASPRADARDEHRDVRDRSAPRRSGPVVASRASSTPCHSGESAANGRKPLGSWLIGKNVPENRNSGSTPRRMIIGNDEVGVLRDRERGERRAERGRGTAPRPGSRARPTPTAPRRAARRRAGTTAAPSIDADRGPQHEAAEQLARRDRRRDHAVEVPHPLRAAQHRPHRLRRPRAASRSRPAGRARRSRGTSGRRPRPCAPSTSPPSPMPIAARYNAGCTNVLNASPRHSRAYTSASRSTTRISGGVDTTRLSPRACGR